MSMILNHKKHLNSYGIIPAVFMVVKADDGDTMYFTDYKVDRNGTASGECRKGRFQNSWLNKGLYVPLIIDEDLNNDDENENYAYRLVFFSKKELKKNKCQYRLYDSYHNRELMKRLIAKYGIKKLVKLGLSKNYLERINGK